MLGMDCVESGEGMSRMAAIIPTLVVALMILVLLVPERVQDIQLWTIPKQVRPDPNRFGMRLVPTVGIFVFAFPLFYGWQRILNSRSSYVFDPFESRTALIGCAFLLAIGIWGCLWPLALMDRFVPQLNEKTGRLSSENKSKVMFIGKVFGVIFLLASVNILQRCIPFR